ncbi:hypothetical protein [Pedobacter nototheniae]|uniref:hypothetical protein n=1 Tax=Pedobacter nototheniae TaxID=2488994 RepID=UPI001039C6F4|nr:hypothetical protein [Pedobacter nototheniae]
MKHLFIALICTIIGFSAFAADRAPKKDLPVVTKIEVKTTSNVNTYITKNNKKSKFFRIQRSFTFTDFCGGTYIIYVSAPNGTSYNSMGATAINAFTSNFDNGGCFHHENI